MAVRIAMVAGETSSDLLASHLIRAIRQHLPDAEFFGIGGPKMQAEGFDARYERMTDADGRASFTPKTGERFLVVAHHDTDESGDGYEATKYSATLTVFVPEVCPCCE